MEPMSTVTNHADIVANAGQYVWVIGRYGVLDVQVDAEVATQHSTLMLEDGTTVMLELPWRKEAARTPEESRRLAGRLVAVSGKILPLPPGPPDESAGLPLPCLLDIQTIKELPEGPQI